MKDKIYIGSMSREQAIGILNKLIVVMKNYDGVSPTQERINALQMAIASLETDEAYQLEYEQPDVIENHIVDTDKMIEPTTKDDCETCIHNKGVLECDMYGCKYEPTTKSETLISLEVYKQVAWERDIAIEQLHELGYEFGQKIEPTTKNDLGVDAISRADAIHAVSEALKHTFVEHEDIANKVISKLPSVTPQEPRKGHWIEHDWKEMRERGYYRCSVCNCGYQRYEKGIRKSDVPYIDGKEYTLRSIDNYCPNCGADMRESEE